MYPYPFTYTPSFPSPTPTPPHIINNNNTNTDNNNLPTVDMRRVHPKRSSSQAQYSQFSTYSNTNTNADNNNAFQTPVYPLPFPPQQQQIEPIQQQQHEFYSNPNTQAYYYPPHHSTEYPPQQQEQQQIYNYPESAYQQQQYQYQANAYPPQQTHPLPLPSENLNYYTPQYPYPSQNYQSDSTIQTHPTQTYPSSSPLPLTIPKAHKSELTSQKPSPQHNVNATGSQKPPLVRSNSSSKHLSGYFRNEQGQQTEEVIDLRKPEIDVRNPINSDTKKPEKATPQSTKEIHTRLSSDQTWKEEMRRQMEELIKERESIKKSEEEKCKNLMKEKQALQTQLQKKQEELEKRKKDLSSRESVEIIKENIVTSSGKVQTKKDFLNKIQQDQDDITRQQEVLHLQNKELQVILQTNQPSQVPLVNKLDLDAVVNGYPIRKIVTIQRVVRNWLSRKKFQGLVRDYSKSERSLTSRNRLRAVQEIYKTELSYVSSLQILENFYHIPMTVEAMVVPSDHKNFSFSSASITTIFSNLTSILSLSKEVLDGLEHRINNWTQSQRVGDIFVKMSPIMKLYSEYINGFDKANKALAELVKSPKCVEFLKSCRDKSGSTLDISSLLIMPIQRLPRYELLLRELMKYTDENHVDYSNLKEALSSIQNINAYTNEKKKSSDERERMGAIQDMIKGCSLIAPHRYFMNEGSLSVSSINKEYNGSFYFFLFNDILIATKKRGALLSYYHEYNYHHHYKLEVSNPPHLMDIANTTMFRIVEGMNSVDMKISTFCANSMEEKAAWIDNLRKILESVEKK